MNSLGKEVVFRADAALAKPEIYEALAERVGLQPGEPVAAAGAAEGNRPLVAHEFAAAAGENRRTPQARPILAIDTIPCETMDVLKQYQWPGNIRELENVIERAVILSSGQVLRVPFRDLHTRIAPGHNSERSQTMEEVERKHILTTLKETRWILSGPEGAATRLGLNRSTLYFRMKKLGIVRPWPWRRCEL